MSAAKRKAALVTTPGGFKTNNIDNIKNTMNAIKSIAAGACIECRTAVFSVNPYGSHGNLKRHPGKPRRLGCDSISPGAQNTTKQAGNLPDSEVFSRPEFTVLDVGIVYPQGRRHNLFCVLNPHIHPECLKSAMDGFQFNKERETMTNVIPLARPRAAKTVQSTTSSPDIPRQQAAIENALSMALYYMRQPRTDSALHSAIGKTNRALTLLKTACTESQTGGAA